MTEIRVRYDFEPTDIRGELAIDRHRRQMERIERENRIIEMARNGSLYELSARSVFGLGRRVESPLERYDRERRLTAAMISPAQDAIDRARRVQEIVERQWQSSREAAGAPIRLTAMDSVTARIERGLGPQAYLDELSRQRCGVGPLPMSHFDYEFQHELTARRLMMELTHEISRLLEITRASDGA
jgi:hypothetical protein